MQLEEKKCHNKKQSIREEIAMGNIVFLHNTYCKKDILQKLAFK